MVYKKRDVTRVLQQNTQYFVNRYEQIMNRRCKAIIILHWTPASISSLVCNIYSVYNVLFQFFWYPEVLYIDMLGSSATGFSSISSSCWITLLLVLSCSIAVSNPEGFRGGDDSSLLVCCNSYKYVIHITNIILSATKYQ